MSNEKVVRRLGILKDEASQEPVPQRKFFHIGQPEVLDDVGECVPMISWVSDNLSRFVVADAPSSSWGRVSPAATVVALPNHAVKAEDGVFLVTAAGRDHVEPHPEGKGSIHFIHLGIPHRLWDRGLVKIYIYRLEAVQFKALIEKRT